jgi:pSer/pThr/pTyr-binding forkhead associated (FHA) protein
MLNAELKILGGKYQGKLIPLSTKRFIVGREQDCQLRPNSELVSRHHCVFVTDDYAVRLRDLGSTNGTRVNGDLIRGEVVLKPGDRVTIGRLEVELVIRKPSEVTAKAPAVPAAVASSEDLGGATPLPLPPAEAAATAPPHAAETSFDITPSKESSPTVTLSTADTAIIPGAAGAPMVPLQAYPQMPQMGYPMGYGYPMPAQMPAYPQPMGGYGYGMPGAYPMPMPGMPQYPLPQQQMPAPAAPTGAELPVRLPDPSQTGLQSAAPTSAAPAAAPATPQGNPSQSAADIIKQYMQRRVSH